MTAPDPIIVQKLASEFIAVLTAWLTPAEFQEVRARNSTEEYRSIGACASHDFCDANMAMLCAFERIVGRNPLDGKTEFSESDDIKLWNAAWDQARAGPLTRLN